MASRVNVKFVVLLSASLVALAVAVAGVFLIVKLRSGDRFVRMGDAAMTRGDVNAADKFYARAVGKDQTRLDWLNKWRQAREKKVPETETVFESDYQMYVFGILHTLARIQRTNVDAHREYLEALYDQLSEGAGQEGWTRLVSETEASLRFFDEASPPPALRRFRGLAYANLATLSDIKDARKLALDDLEAAVTADPKDTRAASGLALLHQLAAAKAGEDRPDVRQAELEAARAALARSAAANPADPYIALEQVNLEAAVADSIQLKGRPASEVLKARNAAMEPLKPRLDAALTLLERAEPASLSASTLSRAMLLAGRIRGAEGLARVVAVTDAMMRAQPGDPVPLLRRAQLHESMGEQQAMLPLLQKLIDLPDQPVGLSGLKLYSYRRSARILQASIALSLALREDEPEARAKALAVARQYRDALKGKIADDVPELLFIDGKFRHAERDYAGSQRSLDAFLKTASPTSPFAIESMSIMADIGMHLQPPQPGLSRDYLEKLCTLRPGRPEPLLALAQLELSLSRYDEALAAYKRVADIDPTNQVASKQIATIEALTSKAGEKKVEDPVTQALIDADRALRGDDAHIGDTAAAVRILEDAATRLDSNPRLLMQLAQLKLSMDDREGALAVLRNGLAKHPDDEALKSGLARLEASGSVEGTLAAIDASDRPEIEKRLARLNVLRKAGKNQEAAAELALAAKAAPDDPRVLELTFIEAISAKDLAKAASITDRAAALDADRAEGDTFRARLLLAQGKTREAAATLQRASERGNANAAVYRFLGNVQLQLNRGPDALKSYRRALELNPTDILAARTLIEALERLGQTSEALGIARSVSDTARQDPDFLNHWLMLESAVGDAALARSMREQILARNPGDRVNKSALADLCITQREWDKARTLIDELRKSGDSIALVALDARWHAARGDTTRARQVFIDHLMGLEKEKKLSAEPFLVMGNFLLQQGEFTLALEALRNGAQFQDPKTMAVDQAIGELELSRGRFEQAEQTFARILAAAVPDPDRRLRKRYIEALVQQKKCADAEREFAALGEAVDGDVELLSQRALNALNAGQESTARQLYDRAVARFPDEPLPYIARARLLMVDPDMRPDALADLATALRLRPGSAQVLRTRAMILFASGKDAEALRDLRTAVDANPGSEEARTTLVQALLASGDEAGAVDALEAGLKARPTDVRLLSLSAEQLARAGKWQRAAPFYRRVWQQTAAPGDAANYAGALISASDLPGAESFLATPAVNVPGSPALLMTRALLRARQTRVRDAQEDCLAALAGMQRAEQVIGWAERVRTVFSDLPTAQRTVEAGLTRLPAESAPWGECARAALLGNDPSSRTEAESILEGLITRSTDRALKLTSCRLLSSLYAADESWDKALDTTRKGLALEPDDVMFNNNAAAFLAEHLSRGAEAMPFVQKALAKSDTAEVLDTLAVAHWSTGEKDKAAAALERAILACRDAAPRLPLLLKLGGWKLDAGDAAGARAVLHRVRELCIDYPTLKAPAKDQIAAFEQRLR
jgi:tetratricopeptide (TPR) repeat protein